MSATPEAEKPEVNEKGSVASVYGVPKDAKVLVVENADHALALSTGPQLSPYSKRSIQLFAILLVSFMGSLSNGFDGSGEYRVILPLYKRATCVHDAAFPVMSAVNGMECSISTTSVLMASMLEELAQRRAIIFGIYSIGSIVGVLVAGPMADRFGRRGGMALGSLIIIVGAVAVTVAKNTDYLLGGRFVLGFGVAITTTAAPAYVVEMSPPQWRGRLTGLYNTFYYSGSILCTGITIATGRKSGTISFRAPLAIQIAPAGILFVFVYFIPESPRWLMSVGRNDKARHILAKYHSDDDENAPLVQLEWKEYEEAIKLDASDKRWWDYSELFNSPNARYRTFMMLLMGFFGASELDHSDIHSLMSAAVKQWSGNGLGYFLTILFQNAGVNSQDRRLILNFANTLISAGGALIGTALTDKVGRRTMWLWGTLACAGMLAIVTGCTAKFGNTGANITGANTAIAAKGMALYAFAVSCASFVNAYAGPIVLGKITWKYYIVWMA
ncbi:hypothetical protein H0H87_001723 [Tephrocybe sp. NHM501043]|nr:hypothetical protein H0H87_001723 [Tephrocybe sp. NHM501043]